MNPHVLCTSTDGSGFGFQRGLLLFLAHDYFCTGKVRHAAHHDDGTIA
jgi:hypothetical protein